MAADPDKAALALHRFGFGPRAGSIAAIASDPQGALAAELDRPNAGQIVDPALLSSAAAFRAVFEFNAARAAQAKLVRPGSEAVEPGVGPATQTADKPAAGEPRPETVPQRNFLAEAKARIGAARDAEIGFVERLVWFWSNHFCVSLDTSAMAGGYEREAIRPHVLGRFVDLLLAAESHPAMLIYLNDAQSIGPNSVAGINRGKGLNENFAREILELHTLGVRTGYTQADVISFAKALTGWTSGRRSPTLTSAASSCSSRGRTSRAPRPCSARPIATPASRKAARCSPTSPAIPRPPNTSRPSSRSILSPTTRQSRSSIAWRAAFATPTAISRKSRRR